MRFYHDGNSVNDISSNNIVPGVADIFPIVMK